MRHAATSIRTTVRPCRARGFTLIELLVTIAIAAVLMLVAAPNFVQFRRNAQLSDAVSNLILSAGTAKSNALKTGRNTFVQVNDTGVGWRSGWFVFVDNNWNNQYDIASDTVVMRHDALVADITVTPTASTTFADGYLMLNGNGFPKTKAGGIGNGTLTLSVTNKSSNVIMDTAGRVRSCKTGTTGCSAT
jgi:type IV fimbrial biogenesis protein FimT